MSDEGRRQAELAAERLRRRSFTAFYTSDLKRAFETAEIIGRVIGMQPRAMPELREIFLGDWEGLNTQEIAERFPQAWARWVEEPDWDVVPGGEGQALFETRVDGALDGIFKRHPRGSVLAVTHGGVIQIALHRVIGRPSRGVFPFKIQNASISELEKRDGRMIIGGVNDVAHLDGALLSEPGPE